MSTALAQAAPLKADIRLAQAISEFRLILGDQDRNVFKNFSTKSPPSLQDIVKVTEEINLEGSRLHRSWQPMGTRLVSILDRIQMLTTAGDLVIGGSQNIIASSVWAVVRLSLDSALRFLSYFEKVSQMLMKLGSSSKINREIIALYPDSPDLQALKCEYLIAVIALCKKIATFSRKSLVSQFTSSLGASFDTSSRGLVQDVEYWGGMIEKKANQLFMQQQQDSDSSLLSYVGLAPFINTPRTRRPYLIRRAKLLQLLSPNELTFERAWRRARKRGTVRWVFEHNEYLEWVSGESNHPLWFRGNLGSGKTVTLANIVAELSSAASPSTYCVLSFFCQNGSSQSVESRWIMGSIAHQVLQDQKETQIFSAALAKFEKHIGDPSSFSTSDITNLILDVLPKSRTCLLVLDALDECTNTEVENVLECLKLLSSHRKVRLCWSSRHEPRIAFHVLSYFSTASVISMAAPEKDAEMIEYITIEIERRKGTRRLSDNMETILRERLCTGAQGMYLWVTLQLEAIFPKFPQRVLSDSDISRMLEILPQSLPEAYDQALDRIWDTRYGSKIFQIVAAALRPLHVDEIRVALNVEAGNTMWNAATFPQTEPQELVGLCGGTLLEVDEESDCVYYIHHSAALHLLTTSGIGKPSRPLHFTERDADLTLGGICVTYLNYVEFDRRLTYQARNDLVIKHVTETVNSSLVFNSSLISKILFFFRSRHQRPVSRASVDIFPTLRSLAPNRLHKDVQRLLGYAHAHCVYHARHFLPNAPSPTLYALWLKLLSMSPERMDLPWKTETGDHALEWALRFGHGGVLWGLLDSGPEQDTMEDLRGLLTSSISNFALSPEQLGNILARYIHYAASADVDPARVVGVLLRQGADPKLTHKGLTSLEHAVSLARLRKDKYLHVYMLKQLVQHGCEPNSDRLETNVLMFFVELGLPIEVELLLKYGARPNFEVGGRSPLGLAIHLGYESVSRILLSFGASIASSFDRRSVLHLAIERGQTAIIEQLISRGATLNFRTEDTGVSALALAVQSGQGDTASFIKSKYPPPPNAPPQPLHLKEYDRHICGTPPDSLYDFIGSEHSDSEDYIVNEHDFELWEILDSSLLLPNGHLSPDFQECLKNGADIDERCAAGFTALDHVVIRNDLEAAKVLLSHNADVNHRMPDDYTPLTLAITLGASQLVDLLLQYNASIFISGQFEETPIQAARNLLLRADVSFYNCNRILQSILKRAKIRGGGEIWMRFIMYAIREGVLYERTLQTYLSRGGSVAESLKNDSQPDLNVFILATQRSWVAVMKHLRKQCDPSILDIALYDIIFNHECFRITHATSSCDHCLQAIRLLLKWDARLMKKGNFAEQAIHQALKCGRDEVGVLLLSYGLTAVTKTREQLTTLKDVAFEHQCRRSLSILRNASHMPYDSLQ